MRTEGLDPSNFHLHNFILGLHGYMYLIQWDKLPNFNRQMSVLPLMTYYLYSQNLHESGILKLTWYLIRRNFTAAQQWTQTHVTHQKLTLYTMRDIQEQTETQNKIKSISVS